MSSVIEYIRALNPVNERKTVVSVLTQLQEEINDYTLPVARELQEAFKGAPLKSAYAKQLTQALRGKVNFQVSVLDQLVTSIERLEDNLPFLELEIKRLFSFQFTRENLTFKRVNLLRYVESALFYVRYFRKVMLRLVAEEALTHGSATPLSWSKAERAWLSDNQREFINLYPAITQSTSELKKTFEAITDAPIDETTVETAVAAFGRRGTDPMHIAGFSPTSNWFFSLGKMLAEWQVKRYQSAKEEHQALQLRMQEYRELKADGKVTPKLQKLIEYTEQRIEQLNYKIAKIEEDNRY